MSVQPVQCLSGLGESGGLIKLITITIQSSLEIHLVNTFTSQILKLDRGGRDSSVIFRRHSCVGNILFY